ncbi:hypothetical protein PENSPDRAFT_683290 [Peniophora sp. CONT]|nr:hypothetical protein PENSPDRAFT_683290 [Peniophora sp. CONT]
MDMGNTPALRHANYIVLILSAPAIFYTVFLRAYGQTDSGNHTLMKLVVEARSSRLIFAIVHLPIFLGAALSMVVLFFVVAYLYASTPAVAILVGVLGIGISAGLTMWAIRHRAGRVVRGQV